MKRDIKYIKADPAGNITAFVLDSIKPEERSKIANYLMEKIDSSIEQVGFISKEGDSYRMDMMGGEFCGNASRSFGLYLGKILGLKGPHCLDLSVSGTDKKVPVVVNVEKSQGAVTLPSAIKVEEVEFQEGIYTTIFLEGIIHTIVDDRKEDPEFAKKIISSLQKLQEEDAYGVMFYNKEEKSMVPFVYVTETNSLIREGSCGSGTISLAYYLNKNKNDNFVEKIKQPGGIIEVKTTKEKESLTYSIGGQIEFEEEKIVEVEI